MTTGKKTKNKSKWKKLPFEEVQDVVRALMNAAQIHKRASVLCLKEARDNRFNPRTNRSNFIDYLLFSTVYFELIFVSVEQSLRLLFLVLFREFPEKPGHDLHALYRELRERDTSEEGICRYIIQEINSFGQIKNVKPIFEDELIACLEKHGSSYRHFKYFYVDTKGKLNRDGSSRVSERDEDIFLCFASALICLNIEEMEKRDFGSSLAILLVPESGMTERLKALKKHALKKLFERPSPRIIALKALKEYADM